MEAKKRKFDQAIVAELNSLYNSGMVGIGQQYESLIELGIKKTGLSETQVKVSDHIDCHSRLFVQALVIPHLHCIIMNDMRYL